MIEHDFPSPTLWNVTFTRCVTVGKISISDFLEVHKRRPCRLWDLITNVFHKHFYKRIFASHFQVIHVIPIHVITEEVAWCFTRFICASVHELTEEQDATVRADILIIFNQKPYSNFRYVKGFIDWYSCILYLCYLTYIHLSFNSKWIIEAVNMEGRRS